MFVFPRKDLFYLFFPIENCRCDAVWELTKTSSIMSYHYIRKYTELRKWKRGKTCSFLCIRGANILTVNNRDSTCYCHKVFVIFSCTSNKQILTFKCESHARLYSSPQSPITLSRSFPFFKTSWMLFTSSLSSTRENTAFESLICSDRPSLTPTIDPATACCVLTKYYKN